MPSGSRQAHTKTRNGCGQCKRRRVRCNLEGPVCSHCRRRKETCDYSRGSPLSLPSSETDISIPPVLYNELRDNEESLKLVRGGRYATLQTTAQRAFPDVLLWFVEKARAGSTIPSMELSTWMQELNHHIGQFSYLEPTVRSVQSLFAWLDGGQAPSEYYALALRYNIEASNRFRLSGVKVNENNWLAILIFGVGIILFHFCIALSSPDADFDFLDMFHVLRKSSRLGRQVGPYFLRSQLGEFIQRRYTCDMTVDEEILNPVWLLESVEHPRETSDEMKTIYCETLASLRAWIVKMEGCPQSWRDFVFFPECVSEAYLKLLQRRDPFALLVFIYWCAIIYRARRWFTGRWAHRAAYSAMSYLGTEWTGLLEWPKSILDSPDPMTPAMRFTIRDHYSEKYTNPDPNTNIVILSH
ncbi:hypothetical protein GGR53DRAFT_523004 [Hypoxylon sp. FL1150]|nr:hypothetical protein GGR53DRAFT_523004 [Hypoxylon sp. FL1150]